MSGLKNPYSLLIKKNKKYIKNNFKYIFYLSLIFHL